MTNTSHRSSKNYPSRTIFVDKEDRANFAPSLLRATRGGDPARATGKRRKPTKRGKQINNKQKPNRQRWTPPKKLLARQREDKRRRTTQGIIDRSMRIQLNNQPQKAKKRSKAVSDDSREGGGNPKEAFFLLHILSGVCGAEGSKRIKEAGEGNKNKS